MNQTTLFRYNFRVLMLNNWWLLVFPLAVSQLTVFWYVLTQPFSLDLPAQSVEMVTPLLAAFLGAHLLSAEYRSRIGAVLASRPVNIGRIVVLRLVVMLGLVWGLALLSLLAYTFGMEPFDVTPPILACIPSTLFLTMLALTFATLFRHALAGFGIAALYWALNLIPGAPLQPYLSLHSLSSYYAVQSFPDHQTFLNSWWIAKITLLLAALLLYLFHARLVFTLGTPLTLRTRRRAAMGAAFLLGLYLVSGAALKTGYGYAHRGRLPPDDISWFRWQYAPFGPLPAAKLFGPAFTRYLGEFPNPWRFQTGEESDRLGDTLQHHHDLAEVVEKMPDSLWAPSAADARARLEGRGQRNMDATIAYYRLIVDRYPQSPYVGFALRQIAHTYMDAERPADARSAYLEVLRFPDSTYRAEALRFLVENDRKAGRTAEAIHWGEAWASAAPLYEKFEAWMDLAELRKTSGDTAGAKQAAQAMQTALREYRGAVAAGTLKLSPMQKVSRDQAAERAAALARSLL